MIKLFDVFMAPEAAASVAQVLTRRDDGLIYVGEGEKVERFEAQLQHLLGLPRTPLATNSCTSALTLALHLAGVGPGDEVISTPMTCTATNGPIVNAGARIVWADVHPLTGLIDPQDVARKISPRTKAITAVDWGGRLCDYAALKRHGIPVIEDAAHAFLAEGGERGDYICWSFGPIKHLTCGDGGALLTPPDQHDRARLLRWHGLDRRSSRDFRCAQRIQEAGYKFHMTDLNAAIGLANLPHIAALIERCRANAAYYDQVLADAGGITLPPYDATSAWWLYCVLVDDVAAFIEHMKWCGITASPVHSRNDLHPAYTFYSGPLRGVDYFARHEVAIPVGWWLSETERAQIAMAVRDYTLTRHSGGVAR